MTLWQKQQNEAKWFIVEMINKIEYNYLELDAKNYLDAINAALVYWEELSPDEKKKRSQLYIAHMTRRDAWKAHTRNADFTYFIIRK